MPVAPGSGRTAVANTAPPTPTFEADTLAGQHLNFPDDFSGKLVLLDFWATWCGSCRAQLPQLVELNKQYSDQGLQIVGITLDAFQRVSADRVKQFTKDNNMPWPQVYADATQVAQKFGVSAIPAVFLIDGSTGRLIASGKDLHGDTLNATIKKNLPARN